jgi:hypothetical protein
MQEAAESLRKKRSTFFDRSPPVLVLITDVYLARAIDVSVSSEEGMSASFSALTMAMVDLSDKKKSLEAQLTKLRPAPKAAGEGEAGKVQTKEDKVTKMADPKTPDTPKPEEKPAEAPVAASSQAKIDQVEAELVQVNAQLREKVSKVAPDLPGVTGSVVRSSALGVTLRQAFARPVAIGFRGINYSVESLLPPKDADQIANVPRVSPGSTPVVLVRKGDDPSTILKIILKLMNEDAPKAD